MGFNGPLLLPSEEKLLFENNFKHRHFYFHLLYSLPIKSIYDKSGELLGASIIVIVTACGLVWSGCLGCSLWDHTH